tara:strand:- start:770 stop:1138 length:369 start_codon:yes stop_codon:yes gene_type:complete
MKCEAISTTPKNHDKATSLISHLPIFLASSLIQTVDNTNDHIVRTIAQKIASTGFADTSRVGGGNPELGSDLAEFNYENILNGIKELKSNLEDFEKLIAERDWKKMYLKLEQSKEIRSNFIN